MTGKTKVTVAVVAVLLVAGLAVGGYFGIWWVRGNSTNRQRQIDQNNYGTQLAYVQDVNRQIREVSTIDVELTAVTGDQKAALVSQRAAIVNEACATQALIKNAPANVAAFAATNCN